MSHFDPIKSLEAQAPCACEPRHPTTANGEPRTLAEVIDHEAIAYRGWGTPTGDFLARQMEQLAQLVRWTGATTPEDHEARMEVWDHDLRRRWEDRGYVAGPEAGRREGRDLAFQEIMVVLSQAPLR
jgi:hypothetical protein